MPPHGNISLITDESSSNSSSRSILVGDAMKSSRRRVKQPLRFSESVVVHPIVHIDDMDDAEVEAIWYEKKDYDAIKNKLIPVIRKMMKNEEVEETEKETTRGLEYRTRKGALRRQHNKAEGLTAVLEEQQRQLEKGVCDDELIRSAYQSANSHCQEAARELGFADESAIQPELNESRTNPLELPSSVPKGKERTFNKLIKQVKQVKVRTTSPKNSTSLKNTNLQVR